MLQFRKKMGIFLIVIAAFTSPFLAITAMEKSKRAADVLAAEREAMLAESEITAARSQYYADINSQRKNLKQAMADTKAQYEQLLKEQPDLVKSKQTTVNQTVIKPVVVKQVVQQTVPSSQNTASKPQASTKTKTS